MSGYRKTPQDKEYIGTNGLATRCEHISHTRCSREATHYVEEHYLCTFHRNRLAEGHRLLEEVFGEVEEETR